MERVRMKMTHGTPVLKRARLSWDEQIENEEGDIAALPNHVNRGRDACDSLTGAYCASNFGADNPAGVHGQKGHSLDL